MSSVFTVGGIKSDLPIGGNTQRFLYPSNEPSDTFSIDNQYPPSGIINSVTNFEVRDNLLAGFRLNHTSTPSDNATTPGTLKLQSFLGGYTSVTDLITVSNTNTITVNVPITLGTIAADINMNSHKITSLAAPSAGGDGTNKTYVDAAVAGVATSITLTGAVTGAGTTGSSIATSFNVLQTLQNKTQRFDFGTSQILTEFYVLNRYSGDISVNPCTNVFGLTHGNTSGINIGPGYGFSYTATSSSLGVGEFHFFPINTSSYGTNIYNIMEDGSSNYMFEHNSNVRIGTNSGGTITNSQLEIVSTKAYSSLLSGTQTAQTGNKQISQYINTTLSPSSAISGYVAGSAIDISIVVPNVTNPAIAAVYGEYVSLNVSGTAGKTLTNSYGFYAGAGSLATASVTNAYGGYFTTPAFGGTATALYADNFSIGYTATTPPTNGGFISGQVAIGTNSIANSQLKVSSTSAYNLNLAGTQTAQTSNRQIVSYIQSVLAPSAQITGNVTGNSIEPTITVPNVTNPAIAKAYGQYFNITVNGTAGKTLTNLYNIFVDTGSLATASVTNAYGGYFSAPTMGGTVNQALYADNLSIGVTGSTPSANGMLISGIINSSNTTDASSVSTAAIVTSGGLGVAKTIFTGGTPITFDFATGVSGFVVAQNTNNTSGSEAHFQAKVGGGSAGDPSFQLRVTGVTNWQVGIDNDNATTGLNDAFTISNSLTPGSSDVLIISSGTNNFGINGYSVGGGSGVIFIANRVTAPTSNPTGGGILYVASGALLYRGSSGTITTVGPA